MGYTEMAAVSISLESSANMLRSLERESPAWQEEAYSAAAAVTMVSTFLLPAHTTAIEAQHNAGSQGIWGVDWDTTLRAATAWRLLPRLEALLSAVWCPPSDSGSTGLSLELVRLIREALTRGTSLWCPNRSLRITWLQNAVDRVKRSSGQGSEAWLGCVAHAVTCGADPLSVLCEYPEAEEEEDEIDEDEYKADSPY